MFAFQSIRASLVLALTLLVFPTTNAWSRAPGQVQERSLPGFRPHYIQALPPGGVRMHLEPSRNGHFEVNLSDENAYDYIFQMMVPPVLGLRLESPSDVLRAQLGLPESAGLVVRDVEKNSAGAKAGILKHDVLLSIGDTDLASADDLARTVRETKEKQLAIKIVRKGEEKSIEVPMNEQREARPGASSYFIGVKVGTIDDAVREQLELRSDQQGVAVQEVLPATPASEAGVQKNDIILEVEGKPVGGTSELVALVRSTEGGELKLKLLREGEEIELKLNPRRRPVVTTPEPFPATPEAKQFRFYGPGVMVQPGSPGGAGLFGWAPNGPANSWMNPAALGELSRQLEDLKKEVDRLREDVDRLEKGGGN